MGWELRNSLVAGCWDTGIEWNDILPEVRKADRPGGREMSDETKKADDERRIFLDLSPQCPRPPTREEIELWHILHD